MLRHMQEICINFPTLSEHSVKCMWMLYLVQRGYLRMRLRLFADLMVKVNKQGWLSSRIPFS